MNSILQKWIEKVKHTTPKNIYANLFNYKLCVFISFEYYFSLIDEELHNAHKKYLFKCAGLKSRSASSRYCNKMKYFLEVINNTIKEHITPNHYNPWGTMKSSTIHATSSATILPPLTSVFLYSK